MMKKSIFVLATVALIFTGCDNNKTTEDKHQHRPGTHVHEDGTVHEDHDVTQQEEFNINDTTNIVSDTVHHHGPGSDHTH